MTIDPMMEIINATNEVLASRSHELLVYARALTVATGGGQKERDILEDARRYYDSRKETL